jgi:hypothetical protein
MRKLGRAFTGASYDPMTKILRVSGKSFFDALLCLFVIMQWCDHPSWSLSKIASDYQVLGPVINGLHRLFAHSDRPEYVLSSGLFKKMEDFIFSEHTETSEEATRPASVPPTPIMVTLATDPNPSVGNNNNTTTTTTIQQKQPPSMHAKETVVNLVKQDAPAAQAPSQTRDASTPDAKKKAAILVNVPTQQQPSEAFSSPLLSLVTQSAQQSTNPAPKDRLAAMQQLLSLLNKK